MLNLAIFFIILPHTFLVLHNNICRIVFSSIWNARCCPCCCSHRWVDIFTGTHLKTVVQKKYYTYYYYIDLARAKSEALDNIYSLFKKI